MLDAGAEVDLLVAAGMGLADELCRLLPEADEETKQKALACAAACGQAALRLGWDVARRYCAAGKIFLLLGEATDERER